MQTAPVSWRTFGAPTLIAMAWILMTIWLAPVFLIYSGLILFAWLFSIPISYAISSARLGDWLERHGIFQWPVKEEDLSILKNSGCMEDRQVKAQKSVHLPPRSEKEFKAQTRMSVPPLRGDE